MWNTQSGHGHAPISAKLVTKILSRTFIELSELIPENLEDPQAETTTFSIEGSTIVPKVISRKKHEVSDKLTWVECFNIYTAVIVGIWLMIGIPDSGFSNLPTLQSCSLYDLHNSIF